MINKILTTIDVDRENSKQVIHYAITLAKGLQAKLIFLHAYPIPANYAMSGAGAMTSYTVSASITDELAKKKESEFKDLLMQIPAIESIPYEYLSLPGREDELIDDEARKIEADLVVIGTHETLGIEAFLGSTAERVTRDAPCPVIVYPQDHPYQSLNKLCLAIDTGHAINAESLNVVLQLAETFNGTLDVVHIQQHDPESSDATPDSNLFEQLVTEMGKYKITYSFSVLTAEEVEQGLMDFSKENKIDLLVLAYRSHNFLKRMFSPGTRKKLVSQSEVPLLILN